MSGAPASGELVLVEGAGPVDLPPHDPELWRGSVLPFPERNPAP